MGPSDASLRKDGADQALEPGRAQGVPGGFSVGRRGRQPGAAIPPTVGRGSAAADYDSDGDVDVAVKLGQAGWCCSGTLAPDPRKLAPRSPCADSSPEPSHGGPARRPRLRRELQAGGSYLSSEDPRLHFGLGEARKVRRLVVRAVSRKRGSTCASRPTRWSSSSRRSGRRSPLRSRRRPTSSMTTSGPRSTRRSSRPPLGRGSARRDPATSQRQRHPAHHPLPALSRDVGRLGRRRPTAPTATSSTKTDAEPCAAREAAISYAAYRLLLTATRSLWA